MNKAFYIKILFLAISGLILVAGIKSFGPNLFYKKFRQAEGCIQVISPARNILTGKCREFPSPCDIPFYYKSGNTCSTDASFSPPPVAAGRIIVGIKINPPWTPEGRLEPAEQLKQQELISKTIYEVIAGLGAPESYSITKFQFIPAFAINADNNALEYLRNHPLVETIEKDEWDKPLSDVRKNIKIGKYSLDFRPGRDEKLKLEKIEIAASPREAYQIYSRLYPDNTDKNQEFYIGQIFINNDTAEVYFGGDEEALTERMGTAGARIYTGKIVFALTEDSRIQKVDFKLKKEGSHFGPGIRTRNNYQDLRPE